MRFDPKNGRHDDVPEEIRWLKIQFELAGRIAELEGSREKTVKQPETYRLAPEEPGANNLY
jgi:hypothetical protein